jgi:hypothetical protein
MKRRFVALRKAIHRATDTNQTRGALGRLDDFGCLAMAVQACNWLVELGVALSAITKAEAALKHSSTARLHAIQRRRSSQPCPGQSNRGTVPGRERL